MRSLRRRGEDQGSAAVEFALVLPVLMIILFGIIDFGRMLNTRITLSQAANEGARAVAVAGDDAAAGVIDAIMGSTTYTVVEIDGCDSPLDDATVTLSHSFTFVTPFVGGDDGMELTATAVVPCL
jgi:Flp pilus assembly protein TadG